MSFGFSVGDFLAVLRLANEVRKQFTDAPRQLKAVSDDIKRLSNVLRDIDDNDPSDNLNDKQKETLNDISRGCRDILKELNKTISKYQDLAPTRSDANGVRKASRRIWKRLTWDQREIDLCRQRVSASIDSFTLFLTDVSRQISKETNELVTVTQHGVSELVQYQHDQRRREILDWLSPITHDTKQADYFSAVQEGTGSWLLESDEFKQWTSDNLTDPKRQRTLFCHGIPGAGKTLLTSIMINELQKHYQQKSVGVTFFYCNFREKTTLDEILAILLKQLIEQQYCIPGALESMSHSGRRFTTNEILEVFDSALSLFSKVFLVIDALDECQLLHGLRKKLLMELYVLQKKHDLRLFLTSRDNPDIAGLFQGKLNLEIRASKQDVRNFLRGRIHILPSTIQKRPDLQEEIISSITERVDGMFLLARLHIESLQGKRSVKAIREALKTLPVGLDAAYTDAMNRIESQLPDEVQTAKEVLTWISCASRPLRTVELQHALAIEDDQDFLDVDNIPDIEDLVSVCSGLVTVDEQSLIVRLVHYTMQEYFDRNRVSLFPNAHRQIGTRCTYYLCFGAFKSGAEYASRLQDHPFFEYAAENWGYHVQKQGIDMGLTLRLLRHQGSVNSLFQTLPDLSSVISGRENRVYYKTITSKCMRGIHLAAYFGLIDAVNILVNQDEDSEINSTNEHGQTPLHFAAAAGFEQLVQLLLRRGALVDPKETEGGRTPLNCAVEGGYEGISRMLADAGADVNATNKWFASPLEKAAARGSETLLKLLLERGARLDTEYRSSRGLLKMIALFGHEAVFRVVSSSVDPGQVKAHCRYLLKYAVKGGSEAIIQSLLKILPPSLKAAYALDSVHLAASDTVLQLLFELDGVTADSPNENGKTPLHMAVEAEWEDKNKNLENTVNFLLHKYGADPNIKDKDGRCVLSSAVIISEDNLFAKEHCLGLVQLLLNTHGIDIESKDASNRTPLHYALRSGFALPQTPEVIALRNDVVRLLLAKGAKSDSKDNTGKTPLGYATRLAHADLVRMLLERGAEADCKDNIGRSPLSYAVDPKMTIIELGKDSWHRHLKEVVEILLAHGADPNLRDSESLTPLLRAERKLPEGHEILAMLRTVAP